MSETVVFRIVLFLHVVGAVIALGFSLSYGLWLARGDAVGGERRAFALQTVSWIDRRLTTPAYVMQAVTGIALVFLTDVDRFREAWLELSIGIYVVLTVLAIARYAPAHRRQTALAEALATGDGDARAYADASTVARRWGSVVTALTVVILFLMVWKPTLWT
ncbi:MAG TPA: DUF2269 family protein [Actinomycetota bacterium]|nr:DUF2269 family protein [Actinomycetota bacterium]